MVEKFSTIRSIGAGVHLIFIGVLILTHIFKVLYDPQYSFYEKTVPILPCIGLLWMDQLPLCPDHLCGGQFLICLLYTSDAADE